VEKGAILFIEPGGPSNLIREPQSLCEMAGWMPAVRRTGRLFLLPIVHRPSPGKLHISSEICPTVDLGELLPVLHSRIRETGLDIAYGGPEIDHCWIANHSQVG